MIRLATAARLLALSALVLSLGGGPVAAQMVVGPQVLPPMGKEAEPAPTAGPVLPRRPARGLAVNIAAGSTAGSSRVPS